MKNLNFSRTCICISMLGFILKSFLAIAGTKEYLYQRILQKQYQNSYNQTLLNSIEIQKYTPSNTVQTNFNQLIDHSNPADTRTFKQRYFINSDYAENNNSPVLYILCGEGECDESSFYGPVQYYAQKYKAHLVALEHRFYGASQPFSELTTDNLKYLTVDFALKDLYRFETYLKAKNNWTGPWVAIGGSYSGSLAAYYRLLYPQMVVGSLASSAPVEAKVNFEEYDQTVADVAGPECAQAIRTVNTQIESDFNNPEKMKEIKHLFNSDDIRDNVDFIAVVNDMANIAIQYGKKTEFCNAILNTQNLLQSYSAIGLNLFSWFGITPLQDSSQGSESLKASDYSKGVGMRQWTWQACSEFGYYGVASSDIKRSTRSQLVNLDFYDKLCRNLFGLTETVHTDKTNEKYFWPLLNLNKKQPASQIFFTNGSTDPWKYLSLIPERNNTTNPFFSYHEMEGASHCSDLGSSTLPAVIQAKNQFDILLSQWLK